MMESLMVFIIGAASAAVFTLFIRNILRSAGIGINQ